MPPLASKSKGKSKDGRRSRSRNTTPSSVISAITTSLPSHTVPYIDYDLSKITAPQKPQYGDNNEIKAGMSDPKLLNDLIDQLRQLAENAELRSRACDAAMREMSGKRKERELDDREHTAREAAEHRRAKKRIDTEEPDDTVASKSKVKVKKRKERAAVVDDHDSVKVKTEGKQNRGSYLGQFCALASSLSTSI